MLVRNRIFVGGLVALMLGGCQTDGGPIGGSSDSLSPQERRLQALEDRVAIMSRRLDAAAGNAQDIAHLQQDVSDMRGILEKTRYDLDQMQKSNKQLFANLDARVLQLEGGTPVGQSSPTAPTTSPGTLTAVNPQRPGVASPEEERAYLAAFDLLKNGKYDDAIKGFRDMLDQWPQGRYADNAWYWIGEANYVKRNYRDALASFNALTQNFPQSPKMPDALLKIGLCQLELKNSADARVALQRVVSDYPNSTAANLAKQRLQQIGG
jgi:tol-pal system protein YbgF